MDERERKNVQLIESVARGGGRRTDAPPELLAERDALRADKEAIARNYDATLREHAALRAEVERLRAALEVAEAAAKAAVSKAQWQAVTNGELNQLNAENAKLRAALTEIERLGHSSHHGRGYTLADIAAEALRRE